MPIHIKGACGGKSVTVKEMTKDMFSIGKISEAEGERLVITFPDIQSQDDIITFAFRVKFRESGVTMSGYYDAVDREKVATNVDEGTYLSSISSFNWRGASIYFYGDSIANIFTGETDDIRSLSYAFYVCK